MGTTVLKPGQQARFSEQRLSIVNNANIDKVMAWKNGLFSFEDASLGEVMRQLERWYNVDVIYEKGIPDIRFEGEISRNINLSDLLKVLARADVKFRIEEGHRLVVLP
jgi:ferric-dicitrate binding protein FerR (iron transport regulator)